MNSRHMQTGTSRPVLNPSLFGRGRIFCLGIAVCLPWFAGCEKGAGGRLSFGDDLTGEHWTIRCFESAAPEHERIVNNLGEQLKKIQGVNAKVVRVKHEASRSILYYGTYKKQFDPKTNVTKFPPQLTQDILVIRALRMGTQTPFALAECELMNKKVVGPPEWDLIKAPEDLSLQIAVFYNEGEFQDRELAAVQYVEALRKEGVEAWYHHYDNGRSVVCVGHFPASAVTRRQDGSEEIGPDVEALMQKNEDFRRMSVNGRMMRVRMPSGEFKPLPSSLIPVRAPNAAKNEYSFPAP
jgi:hypothetical protein